MKSRRDARDAPIFGRGVEGQEGFTPLRVEGAPDEVELAAGAAELLACQKLGVGLAEQVDFDDGVDRYHVVVSGDDSRVVNVGNRVAFYTRVVVHELVQILRSLTAREDTLPGVNGLLLAGNNAFLDKLHHARPKHLGVDSQVRVSHETPGGGIGQPPEAQLDGSPVRDHLGDVAPDNLVFGVGKRWRHLHKGDMVLDDGIHLRDMED